MLDQAWIFKRNGVVLWSRSLAAIKGQFVGGNVVNHLVRTVLLEEKAGAAQANLERYVLKWALANEVGVVFVLVYNRTIFPSLTYVDEFLQRLKEDFLATYSREAIRSATGRLDDYDQRFSRLLTAVETRARALRRGSSGSGAAGGGRNGGSPPAMIQPLPKGSGEEDGQEDGDGDEEDENAAEEEHEQGDAQAAAVRAARLAVRRRGGGKRGRGQAGRSSVDDASTSARASQSEGGGKGKGARTWHDGKGKMNKAAMEALDRSKRVSMEGSEAGGGGSSDLSESAALRETRATYMPAAGEVPDWEKEEAALAFLDEEDASNKGFSGSSGFFSKLFAQVTGNATLEKADLDPILEEMRVLLISKNVAAEIAQAVCDSVKASLVGQKLPSLTRVKTVVREALERAIVRILTPKRSMDLLREVMAARAQGRPYSIVFVGINGVGKSTSLSKVCYYLKSHGLKVLIAACDTFRSGAVEQLKVHARCLEVDVYDKGYHKDPAAVAREAIKDATVNGYDVVLVDTAGRMQNKEPLMRALAKLVSDNEPHLVLFVGEALVGNDGIDQLSTFNQALANYSPPGKTHQIDGIILTKFDTVDEKVGAALSMCYKTGQPILFVGTGQKYTHLKKLQPAMILNCLFR